MILHLVDLLHFAKHVYWEAAFTHLHLDLSYTGLLLHLRRSYLLIQFPISELGFATISIQDALPNVVAQSKDVYSMRVDFQ